MQQPIELSARDARRFVLGKQGLWPGRRWTGKEGTCAAIGACEHLQLDPLVIVARSHDLVLHARVADYESRFFDELTYDERRFFDWGGWLAVRAMEELPHWRVLMRRERDLEGLRYIAEQHPAAIEEMRELLRTGSTVSGRDFERSSRLAVSSYRGSKDSSLALYYLWRVGEAMTHHRDGFERVYAATETIVAPRLLVEPDEGEAEHFLARKAIAFAGIGRSGPLTKTLARKVNKREEEAIEDTLVADGDIVPVSVSGWRGRQFVLSSDLPLLETVAAGLIPREWLPVESTTETETTFLSPLDPVSARGRAKQLFDFDYTWEIYKRPDDVQFGRYTLPILWQDRLVGRMDPRTDRKTGTLVINGNAATTACRSSWPPPPVAVGRSR
jgi:hypothetical protein